MGKTFRQRRPDPNRLEAWIENLNGVRRVPYRLPDLIACAGQDVHVTEGEKDADALAALGVLSTSIADPGNTDLGALRGRRIFVHVDNDAAGERKAAKTLAGLQGVADTITPVRYPDTPPDGDVSDWLAAGRGLEPLLQRCEKAQGAAA